MGTKILAVVLMLGAVGMAVPTMLYGMRFSVLFNRGRQQHDLNDQEKRRRNKNGVLFGICLCCVYGLAWLAVQVFKMCGGHGKIRVHHHRRF